MHSANTDRRARSRNRVPPSRRPAASGDRLFDRERGQRRPSGHDGSRRGQAVALLTASLLALALLGGCAGGTVKDARRGEARDAASSPVVERVQETRIAQIFQPTPGTPVLPTPAATLEELAIALTVGDGNVPGAEVQSFPAGSPVVYAAAHLHHLHAGAKVTALWTSADGTEVGRGETTAPAPTDDAWIALPLTTAGSLGPGEYAVYLLVDGQTLNSLVFRVTG